MAAPHTVADAYTVAVITHFISEEGDHVTSAIAGCINREGNITGRTEKVHDLSFRQVDADGVFRLSRNPMYLGMALIHLSICIFLGSLTPFLIVPVFIFAIDKKFIEIEEKMLKDRFGNSWINYIEITRKWI
jgi:protein-S-isoprenylcysteine O-methyltransferase Ste14